MSNKSNVYLLAYGGTITCLLDKDSDEFYSSPIINIQDLLSQIKLLDKIANIHCEQVSQMISHEMTSSDLINLAMKVDAILNESDYQGIVITQGTNCIEEVAYFLNLVIHTKKPIVLTGAMRTIDSLGFDGLRNIYNAVRVASAKNTQNMGVVLSFNDVISSARDIKKTSSSFIDALSPSDESILGYVHDNRVDIRRTPTYKHTYTSDFKISKISSLPKVYMIYGHLDCDEAFVHAAIENRAAGIISIGMGKGYQPKLTTQALAEAVKNDCMVVRCSRNGKGFVGRDAKLDDKYGFIAGGSLDPQKARILLSVALSQTSDKSIIQNYFYSY